LTINEGPTEKSVGPFSFSISARNAHDLIVEAISDLFLKRRLPPSA